MLCEWGGLSVAIGVVEPWHVMDSPRAATHMHLMIVHLPAHLMSMTLHWKHLTVIMEMRLDHRPRPINSLQHPSVLVMNISRIDHQPLRLHYWLSRPPLLLLILMLYYHDLMHPSILVTIMSRLDHRPSRLHHLLSRPPLVLLLML